MGLLSLPGKREREREGGEREREREKSISESNASYKAYQLKFRIDFFCQLHQSISIFCVPAQHTTPAEILAVKRFYSTLGFENFWWNFNLTAIILLQGEGPHT